MVYIYQNKVNNVMTRFFDKRKMVDSYFLWKIVNDTSKEVTWFITDDISQAMCSYNLFKIEHSDSGLSVGGIDIPLLLKPGHHTYTVYETTEYSINQDFIIGEIETDILFVEIIRTANTSGSNISNVYY